MTRLLVDPAQIKRFAEAIFPYIGASGTEQWVSFRVFPDDGNNDRCLSISSVRVNGSLELIVNAAVTLAQFAADHTRRAVFAPPLASFTSETRAGEAELCEAPVLSVECDTAPNNARRTLETLLGPATVVVASGGQWLNNQTSEIECKLHLHWRLTEPATGEEDLARLKEARRLATSIVGGDPSNVPCVHPLRWPGSWHRKHEPRLATIVAQTDIQIELGEALERLRLAAPQDATGAQNATRGPASGGAGHDRHDPRPTGQLIDNVRSARQYHASLVPLAARLVGSGMPEAAVVDFLREIIDEVPAELHDERWRDRRASIPKIVASAAEKFGTGTQSQAQATAGIPVFDPWAERALPEFPLDILPPVARDFVTAQSVVMGCDASAMAMAVLTAFSGALDHRFAVKMMRHGNWCERPRLWTLLVGDPSRKKTPIINAATLPLEQHQNRLRENYVAELRAYEAAKAKDKTKELEKPEPPPRFVVWDTTTEMLGDVLSRTERELLVKRDELSGWIGAMEKYSATTKAAGADRAFWLQAFDGGPYMVDRIKRGETYIPNLSVSLIGGIQPARLAEFHGLTSDGLLQRFIPIMMRPSTLGQDRACDDGAYGLLILRLIFAKPQRLTFDDSALAIMNELRRHLHELEQASGGLADGFQAFLGKLPGLAASLALILHIAGDPDKGAARPIPEKIAANVHRLVVDFILPHAFAFYRTAEGTASGDRLQRLASYILTSRKRGIVASDLTSNVADLRGLTVSEVNDRLSPLEAGGWLDPVEPKLGRLNRKWTVRPEVFTLFEQRAHQEAARKAELRKLMGASRNGGGISD